MHPPPEHCFILGLFQGSGDFCLQYSQQNSARNIAEPGNQNPATERIRIKLAKLWIKAIPWKLKY